MSNIDNYSEQGGSQWNVGGDLNVTGTVTVPVQSLSSASTAEVTSFGVTVLRCTGGSKTFSIAAPYTGAVKQIVVDKVATSLLLDAPSGVTFLSTAAGDTLKFLGNRMGATLVGISTSQWAVSAVAGYSTNWATTA